MKNNITTGKEVCFEISMIDQVYPDKGMKSGKYFINTMNRQRLEMSHTVLQGINVWLDFQKSLLLDIISFLKGVVIAFIQHSPLLTFNSRRVTLFKGDRIEIAEQFFLSSAEAR
jgi:hypothetical protein